MSSILITGAAGYIGSHAIEALILNDPSLLKRKLVFLDDLSTGHREFIDYLSRLAQSKGATAQFEQIDLTDSTAVTSAFKKHRPEIVLHFAAKISVAESVQKPELYFKNNVQGSKNLLSAMKAVGARKLVFSSTAAVYGNPQSTRAIVETDPLAPVNPYGETKLQIENEIQKAAHDFGLQAMIFRYFNACGASRSGKLGEWHEPETHLIPLLIKAAREKRPLSVFGNDYSTRDGSCIRDYIHVEDLASAHLAGVKHLLQNPNSEVSIFNLGTSDGTSVLEVIRAAEKVLGHPVAYRLEARRPGDSASLIADSAKARASLGWTPKCSDMETILGSALAWESAHR